MGDHGTSGLGSGHTSVFEVRGSARRGCPRGVEESPIRSAPFPTILPRDRPRPAGHRRRGGGRTLWPGPTRLRARGLSPGAGPSGSPCRGSRSVPVARTRQDRTSCSTHVNKTTAKLRDDAARQGGNRPHHRPGDETPSQARGMIGGHSPSRGIRAPDSDGSGDRAPIYEPASRKPTSVPHRHPWWS